MTGTANERLRAVTMTVVLVFSVFAGTAVVGMAGAAGNGTDGTVSTSVATAGNQATVTVDDADLNTGSGSAQTHVVNIDSQRESPSVSKQTPSDTADGSTQTITVTKTVVDRNNDNTIDAKDFTLQGGWPDEAITNVAPNGNDYDVTITDSGSSSTDSSTEYVSYDALTSQLTGADTDQGSPTTLTTTGPVGDRNGDGDITAADIDLVVSSDDESITNVVRNADGTADVTITDSQSNGDSSKEKVEYLETETVRLKETGADTGTFTGTQTLKSSFSAGNDELYVAHQDEITVSYWDNSASTQRTGKQTYKVVAASGSATPSSPATGESVSLDATSSEGSIASYAWDTDGDKSYDDATGSTHSMSFSTEGVRQIGLKVDDGNGNFDTTTVNVLVGESAAPNANLSVYPFYVTKGETAYLVADESSDDIPNGIQKYEFDVGADGSYEYSSTRQGFAQHTFSTTGDKKVKVRVTDYAGNTDTVTKTVTVQGKASISNTKVEHTGNGTAPSGTVKLSTRNEGGMLKLHLYRGASTSNRDLSAAGVDESTELWVNVTIDNYEPNAMMASAKVDDWTTSPNSQGSGTNISIKMHPINMQRLDNPGSTSPGRWPSKNKQADTAITPGAHLATFDMPDGTQFESDFDGATLTSDAQQFSPPRYDSQTNQLTYNVAAPHWKATGNKVASNTNTGFYEAWIPSGLVDRMGITDPSQLAGSYRSGGTTSDLSNMVVEETSSGGLHINVTGIHYSSGTVQLKSDTTVPTADAGSDLSTSTGTSVSFDGSSSSDNRKIDSYEWDVDGDGTYELTGESPSHSYSSTGDRSVTLRVTDGNGNTATDTVKVTVTDGTGPTASAGSDTTVTLGTSVTFDGSGSADNVGVTSYEWDFDGDGSTDATGATASHTFSTTGTHDVTLTVTDGVGNTDTATRTVTVEGDDDTTVTNPVEVIKQGTRTDVVVRSHSGGVSVALARAGAETGNVSADRIAFDTTEPGTFTLNVSTPRTADAAGVPEPNATDVGRLVGYVQVGHSVSDDRLSDVTLNVTVGWDVVVDGPKGGDMVLYRYHDGEWQPLETKIAGYSSRGIHLTAESPGLSVFAVGSEREPAFAVSDRRVASTTVAAGDPVTVAATVTNDGTAAGERTLTLSNGDETLAVETVRLLPGQSMTVEFTPTFDAPGEYDLRVDGTSAGTVTVERAATPTPAPTDTPTGTSVGTSTATPTVTPVSTATPSPTPTPTARSTASDANGPGFGALAALLAVALAALAAARRRR